MNIDNLMREHKGIFEEINYISESINNKKFESDLLDITTHINKLAGKLKIHLSSEDNFYTLIYLMEMIINLKT